MIVVGGVCLTGALAAVSWKMLRRTNHTGDTSEHSAVPANVVPFHPRISYGFSSGRTQHPKDILLRAIREAGHSLDVAIYTFTDLDVALEMIKAHRRGVKVRIITDMEQSKQNEYQRRIISELVSEGILVKMNIQEDAFMHLKVIVADGKTITVGSFNFTMAAVSKHEEVLVRIDDVTMARDWQGHFDYMWRDRRRYALHREVAQGIFA